MELKDIKSLGERLKYIRKEKELSQSDLAKLAGTTQQAIQQAEAGKARNPRYLSRLAQEIGVPFSWLSLNVVSDEDGKGAYLSAQESEFLNSFKAMDDENQEIILKLMKSRTKK